MHQKMIPLRIVLIFLPLISLYSQLPEQVGFITVKAPDSLHIFLNEELISRGSFESLALQPGTYKIHAYNMKNLSWINRGIEKTISIHNNENKFINFSDTHGIKILSMPPASQVFYNEKYLGKTPILFFPEDEDTKNGEITIIREGYQKGQVTLNGGTNEYKVILKPKDNFPERIVYKSSLKSGGFRWSREGLIVASLATSWLSFYFKREADRNYDKYLRASDPGKMETYYDRTSNLDAYAEISVGISVLSLGTYFYFLLTD
jgi:hypothetical protein